MKNITPNDTLGNAIKLLEAKREEELKDLKEQFRLTYDSLKPINLIKNTFKEATQSTDLKNGFGNAAIGIASGFVARKIFFSSSRNPIRKLAGIVFQSIVSGLAARNSDQIKSTSQKLIHAVTNRIKSNGKEISKNEFE